MDRDLTFEPRNVQTGTGVNTATETKMRVRLTFQRQDVGRLEDIRVSICASNTERYVRASFECFASQLDIARCPTII